MTGKQLDIALNIKNYYKERKEAYYSCSGIFKQVCAELMSSQIGCSYKRAVEYLND